MAGSWQRYFFIFKQYVQSNYNFETSNVDNSEAILEKVMKTIHEDDPNNHSDVETEMLQQEDDINIMMEPDSD